MSTTNIAAVEEPAKLPIERVEVRGDTYVYYERELDCSFEFSRIYESSRDSRVTAELSVKRPVSEPWNRHIYQGSVSMLSVRDRHQIADLLHKRLDSLSVEAHEKYLEDACLYVLARHRQGEPVVELHTSTKVEAPQYKLYPVAMEGEANLFSGDGGSGKTYLSLLWALTIQLPWTDNQLGLEPKAGRVLFLDFESTEKNTNWRIAALRRGLGLPHFGMSYLNCVKPFGDIVDQILNRVKEGKIDTVIVDSLGVALAGDLNSAEVATKFFSALRRLHVTSIIVHHVSKASKEAYGSVFFQNLSRSAWQVVKEQEPDENTLIIGLHHVKANMTRKHSSLGFKLTVDEKAESVLIERADAPQRIERLSAISEIILAMREANQPMTIPDISEVTNLSQAIVKARLNDAKDKKVVKLNRYDWGLLSHVI